MILYKVVIGVVFNKKYFSLSGVGGALAEDLVDATMDWSEKGFPFFDQLAHSGDLAQTAIGLLDTVGKNALEIRTDQVVYTRVQKASHASLSLESVLDEFGQLYKIIEKRLGRTTARRIGVVGELFEDMGEKTTVSPKLINVLSNVFDGEGSSNFHINFNKQEAAKDDIFDPATSDYWNCIYSIYPAEKDSFKKELGGYCASIDMQRYFNPAKADVPKQARLVAKKFSSRKQELKARLLELGLING